MLRRYEKKTNPPNDEPDFCLNVFLLKQMKEEKHSCIGRWDVLCPPYSHVVSVHDITIRLYLSQRHIRTVHERLPTNHLTHHEQHDGQQHPTLIPSFHMISFMVHLPSMVHIHKQDNGLSHQQQNNEELY